VHTWVPEDFNLDVSINGDITGVNMKDTKLISKSLSLRSESGSIRARRLRNDKCVIEALRGDIDIGSYIESGDLMMRTGTGEIKVTKRLGVVQRGTVVSEGGRL